ncbi:hypothetical protein PR202_gb17945 [Eleusine coracana subsp. coracana]|uniref:Early nodulin-93-like n=1 Tax=Eleusine coracana subsp. coracana TaxID=191504 RepID=A0AAV5F5P6_ELECO|nr:hypothetical protein PR202_gb17945 [Eleusine coracana subsp. coracana]
MHGLDRKVCLNRVIIEEADHVEEEVNRTYPAARIALHASRAGHRSGSGGTPPGFFQNHVRARRFSSFADGFAPPALRINSGARLASCNSPLAFTLTLNMATVSCASLEQKLALAKRCSREATLAGAKAAAVATIASAIPTLASVRMLPWAKANINPTGQALIISTVAGMAYFIAADKKILSLARKHSFEGAPDHLKNTGGPCSRSKGIHCNDHRLLDPTLAGMACFITADEEENRSPARKNSSKNTPEHLKNASFFQGTGTGRRP